MDADGLFPSDPEWDSDPEIETVPGFVRCCSFLHDKATARWMAGDHARCFKISHGMLHEPLLGIAWQSSFHTLLAYSNDPRDDPIEHGQKAVALCEEMMKNPGNEEQKAALLHGMKCAKDALEYAKQVAVNRSMRNEAPVRPSFTALSLKENVRPGTSRAAKPSGGAGKSSQAGLLKRQDTNR